MDSTKRIIVNTSAQYVKAIVNIGLSLYSTRLVLDALSISDYGIYAVVAGVVSMLGFITNALVATTQRYISFHFGHGDKAYVGKVFINSLFLHLVLAMVIALFFVCLKPWLFGGVLNIDASRIDAAVQVYFIAIVMLCCTIVAAPFKALFIARENIVYIAVVEVCDGVLKLLFAIGLAYVTYDKLLVYALYMLLIQLLNLTAFAVYARWRFEECRLSFRQHNIDRTILSQLAGFAGWTSFGAGAVAARTQGTNVIINHFMGTVANAAYGIAAQVNSAIIFVSTSIINAMNPQIMKAEGAGDRQRVLILAGQESKYSFSLLALASIPIMMELPAILGIWLKEVPQDTAMFCTFTLIICLCDQLTIGLHTVNQAQGKIGAYTLLMFTPKLLNLPLAWLLLYLGQSLESVMWSILLVEVVTAIARLPYLKYTAGLDIAYYLHHTVLPVIPLVATLLIVGWACTSLLHFPFRFLFTIAVSLLAAGVVAWNFTLDSGERNFVIKLIKDKRRK